MKSDADNLFRIRFQFYASRLCSSFNLNKHDSTLSQKTAEPEKNRMLLQMRM